MWELTWLLILVIGFFMLTLIIGSLVINLFTLGVAGPLHSGPDRKPASGFVNKDDP